MARDALMHAGFALRYGEIGAPVDDKAKPPKPDSKVKYTCPSCSLNVWGKPNIRVACVDCVEDMTCAADTKTQMAA